MNNPVIELMLKHLRCCSNQVVRKLHAVLIELLAVCLRQLTDNFVNLIQVRRKALDEQVTSQFDKIRLWVPMLRNRLVGTQQFAPREREDQERGREQ